MLTFQFFVERSTYYVGATCTFITMPICSKLKGDSLASVPMCCVVCVVNASSTNFCGKKRTVRQRLPSRTSYIMQSMHDFREDRPENAVVDLEQVTAAVDLLPTFESTVSSSR